MRKVLVVDDDPAIVSLIKLILTKNNYTVAAAYTGEEALKKLEEEDYDGALLDMMLPDINGITLIQKIRSHPKMSYIPLIMVTSKQEEIDTVLGLEMGADDYIHKPFKKRELVARLNAIFRRMEQDQKLVGKPICFGEIRLNPYTHQVMNKELEVIMSPKEFKLLLLLASNPNRVFTRDELLNKVWDDDVMIETRTVDVHIRRIRKKIEVDPKNPTWIETVRGYGYRFAK